MDDLHDELTIVERGGRFIYVMDGCAILNAHGALISYGRREDAERMRDYWQGWGIYPRRGDGK